MRNEEYKDIRRLICNACNNQFSDEPCEPTECIILDCLESIIEVKSVCVPMEMRKAVKSAVEHYENAVKCEYVRDPVAWALYHAWKDVERGKM